MVGALHRGAFRDAPWALLLAGGGEARSSSDSVLVLDAGMAVLVS